MTIELSDELAKMDAIEIERFISSGTENNIIFKLLQSLEGLFIKLLKLGEGNLLENNVFYRNYIIKLAISLQGYEFIQKYIIFGIKS